MDFLGRVTTFVRVVEAGSLSGAARSLRLSLAAVSRQIATLEAELGTTLVARTTRSLRVTDEGRRFHEHAIRLVREAEEARASVRKTRALSGLLVVSASVTLGALRIVPSLPAFLEAHPALRVDLRLEDRPVDLVSEGVDVAVRAGMALPDTTRVVAHPLATFQRLLVASPAYLRRHGTPRTVASLASHAAITGIASTGRWSFLENGEEHAVSVTPKLRVGTLLAVREAALAGLGVAIFPDFVIARELDAGSLRRVLPSVSLAPVTAHAIHRVEARGLARVDAFVAHQRAALREAVRQRL